MARRPAPARLPTDREAIHELKVDLADLRAWRDGHEKRCEDRAEEFRSEAAGIREEMKGVRRDIGRLVQSALDAKPKPHAISEADIGRLVKEAVAAALPARGGERSLRERLRDWLDIGYKVVFIPGGLAFFFLFLGAVFDALGKATAAAGAHIPGH